MGFYVEFITFNSIQAISLRNMIKKQKSQANS
ncbi:Uncharacterised protein [uncultured archaeon]|nr:Uncharacterised protein [uncultured archaeon]